MLVATAAACDSGTEPSDDVTAITVEIASGPAQPIEGQTVSLRATATLDDGYFRDVTSSAQWTAEGGVVLEDNVVKAMTAGPATVRAQAEGVTGSIQLTVQAATVVAGSQVMLPGTFTFDFDTGTIGPQTGRDIWYEIESDTEARIDLQGTVPVTAVSMGATPPGRGGCAFASPYSSDPIPVGSLVNGTFYCIHTNGGRYAEMRIDAAPTVPYSASSFVFTYRLFDEP